jgi:hypothetical protein
VVVAVQAVLAGTQLLALLALVVQEPTQLQIGEHYLPLLLLQDLE